MPGAALVHDYLRRREPRGDVPGPAGMVEVDMGDDYGGKVIRSHTQRVQRRGDHWRRWRGASLHQARPVAADEVARRDPGVAGHPRVDLEDIPAQIRNPSIHRPIVAWDLCGTKRHPGDFVPHEYR